MDKKQIVVLSLIGAAVVGTGAYLVVNANKREEVRDKTEPKANELGVKPSSESEDKKPSPDKKDDITAQEIFKKAYDNIMRGSHPKEQPDGFDPEDGSDSLYWATWGIGTRDWIVFETLSNKTKHMLKEIFKYYAEDNGETIKDLLLDELDEKELRRAAGILIDSPIYLTKEISEEYQGYTGYGGEEILKY